MQLVTIFSAFNSTEAELVRSRLDAAGFHPFLANETAPFYLQGISDAATVRVQVPEDEAAPAREFLEAPGESEAPIEMQ